MNRTLNRQFVLASRPDGKARLSDFRAVERTISPPGEGEVLIRNELISVDPYQRNLMGNASSELPPIDLGQPMSGPTIGEVIESKHAGFIQGDRVVSWTGWQEYAISDGTDLQIVDTRNAPVSTALGVLGHTGLTAWTGMRKYLRSQPGSTFVVTAAAGSIGSLVAQLAKMDGHRVIGIAGGPEKVDYLKNELGVDEAVDYKAADFAGQLKRALSDGLDRLYDNVGGYMFEALMPFFNHHAQIVIGGTIAQYDFPGASEMPNRLPELLKLYLYRFIEIHGFSVTDHFDCYPEFLSEVAPLVSQGKIKYAEEFIDGFENIPDAFLRLFDGRSRGKLIVRLSHGE